MDTCDDFVLLQYEKHLELWQMGQACDEELATKLNGDSMSMLRAPRKFLHLKSKNELHIVCSSIGSHPSNSAATPHILWLSYSDLNVIHIYKIEITGRHQPEPSIKVDKIKALPLACGNRPAVIMKFFNYSSNQNDASTNQLRFCYLTNKSCLQSLRLIKDNSGFMLESTIQCVQQGD